MQTKKQNSKSPKSFLKEYRAGRTPTNLRIIYQSLSLSQPGSQINYDISYGTDVVERHTHTFYEILLVCQSEDVEYELEGKRFKIKQGDLIIIPPGTTHHPVFPNKNQRPYERYALWLDADFFERFLPVFPELGYALKSISLLHNDNAEYTRLYEAFHNLWLEQQEARYGWQAALALRSMCLMADINRSLYYSNANSRGKTVRENLLQEALTFIDRNFSGQISMSNISKKLGVSTSTISHLFEQQIGVSFYQCVIKRRLLEAKKLILQGELLCEIWESCGFADYSSFFRLFKKEFGVSPKRFQAEGTHGYRASFS